MHVLGHKIVNDMSTSFPLWGSETSSTSDRLLLTYDQRMDLLTSAQLDSARASMSTEIFDGKSDFYISVGFLDTK